MPLVDQSRSRFSLVRPRLRQVGKPLEYFSHIPQAQQMRPLYVFIRAFPDVNLFITYDSPALLSRLIIIINQSKTENSLPAKLDCHDRKTTLLSKNAMCPLSLSVRNFRISRDLSEGRSSLFARLWSIKPIFTSQPSQHFHGQPLTFSDIFV